MKSRAGKKSEKKKLSLFSCSSSPKRSTCLFLAGLGERVCCVCMRMCVVSSSRHLERWEGISKFSVEINRTISLGICTKNRVFIGGEGAQFYPCFSSDSSFLFCFSLTLCLIRYVEPLSEIISWVRSPTHAIARFLDSRRSVSEIQNT